MDERDRRHRREFEPPPWEKEAFERFEQARKELEAEAELEAALASVRTEPAGAPTIEPGGEVLEAAGVAPTPVIEPPEVKASALSTAELETMLIGLRHQEPVVTKNYKTVANVASALLAIGGLGFMVWAAVLFARVGNSQGLLPTLASLLLMVWGFLLIGGAVLLFRKYNVS